MPPRRTGASAPGCRAVADRASTANIRQGAGFLGGLAWRLQGDSGEGRLPLVNGTKVGPVSVLPDEPACFREDATLPLVDVHGTELDRAGGVEEPAVACFQDGEAGPPQRRVEAEGLRTA